MIKKIDLSGVHMDVGDDLHKYAVKKLGRLDVYIPKNARLSAHIEIKLKESRAKDKNERTCEVILHLPQDNLMVSETTVSIYAAIDIAEQKLKMQIHKYKEQHGNPGIHRRVAARLKRGLF